MNIKIKELPEYEVTFMRRNGSYFEPQDHWGKLVQWVVDNELYPPNHFFIGISLVNQGFMYEKWPPNSEYDADFDRDNLEFNLNNLADDPEGKCKVDLYVPI